MNNIHVCTNRCNDDLDCEVCDHGVNIAQDECQDCIAQEEDANDHLSTVPKVFAGYFGKEILL